MQLHIAALVCAGALLLCSPATALPGANADAIQGIVDEFRAQLSISEHVVVALVDENPLLVSVQRRPESHDTFVLIIEQAFLDALDDDDLRAVVAHELGHLWIFTHHPYLHTEALANRIAVQLVTREELERVYAKVWKHQGAKGDLDRFLGSP